MHALIAGYGSIGRRHAENLHALVPGLRASVLRASGARSSAELPPGTRALERIADAIAEKPDVALICTPSSCRLEYLLPLLDAGVPCYVEKPLVASVADAQALRRYIGGARRLPPVEVGCNLRLLPSLQKLRALLGEGSIGKVLRASFTAGQWLPDWRAGADYRSSYSARADAGGGVILDLVHEIDAARWFLGELAVEHALAGKFSRLAISSEDVACLLLRGIAGPPLVSINLDYISRRRVRRYEIVGDEGTLVWDLERRTLERLDAAGVRIVESGEAPFDVPATYRRAMQVFLARLGGGPPSCGLEDGLASAELALQAKQKAAA